jgi:hypothetical protein
MALTPEGSPYVESSDLVATYPTTSLALANRVDLVGVLPFATSAARATAIPSPTDGQYSYLQDTNLTQFWNGSAWQTAGLTPGLTMVTPTSIANSGGSSALSGNSVTFTAVNSISLNGIFNSTYANYRIMINLTDKSASAGLTMRLRAAGTDTTSATYQWANARLSGTLSGGTDDAATSIFIPYGQLNKKFVYIFDIVNAAISAGSNFTSSCYHFDSQSYISVGSGGSTAAVAHDGFTFISTTGTITGTIRVYGYQSS